MYNKIKSQLDPRLHPPPGTELKPRKIFCKQDLKQFIIAISHVHGATYIRVKNYIKYAGECTYFIIYFNL